MTSRAAAAAAMVVLAGALAGCGGDAREAYCDEVADQQAGLTRTLDPGGNDALLSALPTFRDLADDAPRDIRADWTTVVDALERLQGALDDADVDAATYDRDDPPAGLSADDKAAIDAAARELASAPTVAAFDAVQQQAKDVCGTPLTQ